MERKNMNEHMNTTLRSVGKARRRIHLHGTHLEHSLQQEKKEGGGFRTNTDKLERMFRTNAQKKRAVKYTKRKYPPHETHGIT